MSRRTVVAVALVAVLTLSLLAGLGAASMPRAAPSSPVAVAPTASTASIAAPSAAPHPSVTEIGIDTYNAYGDFTQDFCTGSCISFNEGSAPGDSTIYFSVGDLAADHEVNVTINDQNATRDGITNPVLAVTLGINQTTHENVTPTDNHFSYTFPGSLAIGGQWNITASAPLGGFAVTNLTVFTYSLDLESQPGSGQVVVPGESVNVSWIATATGNGATYGHLTSLTTTGTYNGTGENLFQPGLMALPTVGAGTFTFQVPANATPDTPVFLYVWAVTNTSGYIAENETGELEFTVGEPQIYYMTLSPVPGCGISEADTFASGSPVYVCLWVRAHVPFDNTLYPPGLHVAVSFWNGTKTVTPLGAPPSALTTTSNGPLEFSFIPTAPLFSSEFLYPFYNSVNITVTDPAATAPGYLGAYENYTFFVIPTAVSGQVTVALNEVEYDVGSTVTATWSLSSSNTTLSGTLEASQWAVVAGDYFIATAPIAPTTNQTGTFHFALPSTFVGPFEVYVLATNASGRFIGLAVALAEQPTVLVSAEGSTYYTAGQTLTFQTSVNPSPLPGTTVYYNITGEWWNELAGAETSTGVVAVGTVPVSGAVSYTVPSTSPAQYYLVTVWAQSPAAGVYAWNTNLNYTLETGFAVLVGISTPSSYADGSYQPGQTIQVTWSLSPYGNAPLPAAFTVYVYLDYTPVTPYFQTTSSSGTVSVTIPSSAPSGQLYLYVDVYAEGVYGPNCDNGDNCYSETGLTVNAHPSALAYELGAGSGLTVGWLILLVLILVVAVLLVLLIRRGRSRPSMAPTPMAEPMTHTMAPPAPPPSSPPASEWRDPSASNPPPPPASSASDAPPPLPNPPGGSP